MPPCQFFTSPAGRSNLFNASLFNTSLFRTRLKNIILHILSRNYNAHNLSITINPLSYLTALSGRLSVHITYLWLTVDTVVERSVGMFKGH